MRTVQARLVRSASRVIRVEEDRNGGSYYPTPEDQSPVPRMGRFIPTVNQVASLFILVFGMSVFFGRVSSSCQSIMFHLFLIQDRDGMNGVCPIVWAPLIPYTNIAALRRWKPGREKVVIIITGAVMETSLHIPIQPINCLFLTSTRCGRPSIELTLLFFLVVVTVGIISEDEARELFDMCAQFYFCGGRNQIRHLFISAAFTMDARHSSPFSMPRWIRTKHCAADRRFASMRYVWSLQKSKMEAVSYQTFFLHRISPHSFETSST